MKTTQREAVAALGEAIARHVGAPRYKLWFENHTKFAWDEATLTVGVPNRHFGEYLEKTFRAAVAAAAQEVFGRPAEVRFAIDAQLFQAARRDQAEAREAQTARARPAEAPPPKAAPRPAPTPAGKRRPSPASPEPEVQRPAKPAPRAEPPARARRWRRLSEFVVGPCNRVAHASALSVVEAPGDGANPLVLHGPVGTGKTHLLEGVYAGLRRARPDWRVLYVTSEDFTNRFVQAMRLGKLGGFRKHFREADALLVDDLHFLARKRATQEEFLHTFDALLADGRQMVLTCDCHPRLADDFTPELTDRLLGGAAWGLAPPDADTRLAVLRAKALRPGEAPLPDEVLRYLAAQLRGNVRELEGAVNGVRHYSRVTGRPADLALVREALADLLRHAVRVVQVGDVDRAVCAALRLEAGALQSKARAWAVSHPRMVAMFLARKHTAASYSEIGGHFGGRNHSTAVAAEKKVRGWLQEDGELALGERRVRVREVVERVERDLLR
ncbi:MAG TPA: chromosomal replication initiator protein DnaA [Gemmataceae bacterium]|nr:chromosomal replication initiator protein DnaA [Gemmataceae bacterium]